MPDPYAHILELSMRDQLHLADHFEERFLPSGQDQDRLIGLYVSVLEKFGAGSLLEAGCGTGRVLRNIAAALPSLRVVGVEPSRVFLDVARSRDLAVVEGTGERLPLRSQCVDVVLFHATLSHVSRIDECIAEAARAAAGCVAVFDVDVSQVSCPRWSAAVDRFFDEYVEHHDVFERLADALGPPEHTETYLVEQDENDSYLARHIVPAGCALLGGAGGEEVRHSWAGGRLAYRFELFEVRG